MSTNARERDAQSLLAEKDISIIRLQNQLERSQQVQPQLISKDSMWIRWVSVSVVYAPLGASAIRRRTDLQAFMPLW
jgi:hypothetical protein